MALKLLKNINKGLKSLVNFPKMITKLGCKGIKGFIDNNFREKVVPIEGSVIYTDLYIAAEHSGIYIGNNKISNIVVTKFAESEVKKSKPDFFTDKAKINSKIYVSCNKDGAVGDLDVCKHAKESIGEKDFYGLLFKNCHEFSTRCVNHSKQNHTLKTLFLIKDIDETWETTIKILKDTSRKKLGATKWKLWDWKNDNPEPAPEPDIDSLIEELIKIKLNDDSMQLIISELNELKDYQDEISDENIPEQPLSILNRYHTKLSTIHKKYNEAKEFIKISGDGYSYEDLEVLTTYNIEFENLAAILENNNSIKDFLKKLGREYISATKKTKISSRISTRLKNELHGVEKTNDLMRLLPAELINLENEELEYLFYAKMYEHSLSTYKLIGKENYIENEEDKNRGPIVACVDTSGSMSGGPLLKAKALMLAICKILEKENRELHIILFGDSNQLAELSVTSNESNFKVLKFLSQGYGGGTDFESPITRSTEILESNQTYKNADILMITDGLCSLTDKFISTLNKKKVSLGFNLYTIICDNSALKSDNFSDEILNI